MRLEIEDPTVPCEAVSIDGSRWSNTDAVIFRVSASGACQTGPLHAFCAANIPPQGHTPSSFLSTRSSTSDTASRGRRTALSRRSQTDARKDILGRWCCRSCEKPTCYKNCELNRGDICAFNNRTPPQIIHPIRASSNADLTESRCCAFSKGPSAALRIWQIPPLWRSCARRSCAESWTAAQWQSWSPSHRALSTVGACLFLALL
jgi:hypothetical protein